MKTNNARKAQCPVFQDMTLEEREQVLALFENEHYPAGETILREGLSIQILWIIVAGRCEVLKSFNGAPERSLAVLEQGAVFGEMSFFNPAPHSASVRALTDVEVIRLSRERYDELLSRNPAAAYKVAANTASVLAERLRKMDDWTCQLLDGPDVNAKKREEWHDFRAKLYTEWDF